MKTIKSILIYFLPTSVILQLVQFRWSELLSPGKLLEPIRMLWKVQQFFFIFILGVIPRRTKPRKARADRVRVSTCCTINLCSFWSDCICTFGMVLTMNCIN